MIYFFDDYKKFSSEYFLSVLPEARRQNFERLKREKDRDNCVLAYLLLRLALAENGITDFEIITGQNGKPFLKSEEKFFNISHCSQGVAVVLDDSPVGIDVQEKSGFNEKVAKRFFTDEENKKISSSADSEDAFIRMWTLKESIIKCEAASLVDIGKYSFENYEKYFEKYGKKFSCFSEKNILISVCGNEYFNKIKIIDTEDFV